MYSIRINGENNIEIIKTVGLSKIYDTIKDKIFDEELVDYRVVEREDFIDDLIGWISECNNSDKVLMKEDLKYLMSLPDKYIFSSFSTNEYIAESDNPEEWNMICEEILELNKKGR